MRSGIVEAVKILLMYEADEAKKKMLLADRWASRRALTSNRKIDRRRMKQYDD